MAPGHRVEEEKQTEAWPLKEVAFTLCALTGTRVPEPLR